MHACRCKSLIILHFRKLVSNVNLFKKVEDYLLIYDLLFFGLLTIVPTD